MTDPSAWAERMLELAREADEPSRADRSRVRALLVARCLLEPSLAAAAAHSGASAGVAASSKAALGSKALLSKALVAFGIGGAAGAATSVAVLAVTPESPPRAVPAISSAVPPNHETASRAPASMPAPTLPVPAAPPEREAPTAAALPTARGVSLPAAAGAIPSASSAPMPAPSHLSVELDSLRRAQQLLHRGEARSALAVLGELERLVPAGVLGEERAATRALAACAALGRAQARIAEFVARYPSSVHVERVRAACEPGPRGSEK